MHDHHDYIADIDSLLEKAKKIRLELDLKRIGEYSNRWGRAMTRIKRLPPYVLEGLERYVGECKPPELLALCLGDAVDLKLHFDCAKAFMRKK